MTAGIFLGIVIAVAVVGLFATQMWSGMRVLGRRTQLSITESPKRRALPPADELTTPLLRCTAALIRVLETAQARLLAADHTQQVADSPMMLSSMPLMGYADDVLERVFEHVSTWLETPGSDAAHLDDTRDRLEDTQEYLGKYLAEHNSKASFRSSPTMAQTLLKRIEGDLAAVSSSFDELRALEEGRYR